MNVVPGSTDVTTYFHLRLAADGTDATGLTIANIDLQYTRSGATPAAKVDATALAAANTAHTDNYAFEIDATDQPGVYRVDWPDAAFAAGVREAILTVKCATVFTESLRAELDGPGLAAIKADTAAILIDTAEIGTAGAGLTNINLPNQTMDIVGNITGNLSGSVGSVTGAAGSVTGNVGGNVTGSVGSVVGAVGSVTGAVGSVTGAVGSVTGLTAADVGAIKLKTDALPSDPADASVIAGRFDTLDTSVADLPTNAELSTALGTADDAVLTAIGDLPTNAELATALGTADDAVLTAIGDLPTNAELATALDPLPTAAENAAALMDLANGVETGLTPRQALRVMAAASAGKLSGAATTTVTIRNAEADSKNRIVATVDADGNRSAITLDVT